MTRPDHDPRRIIVGAIAHLARLDPRTVVHVLDGRGLAESRDRVVHAARLLGISRDLRITVRVGHSDS